MREESDKSLQHRLAIQENESYGQGRCCGGTKLQWLGRQRDSSSGQLWCWDRVSRKTRKIKLLVFRVWPGGTVNWLPQCFSWAFSSSSGCLLFELTAETMAVNIKDQAYEDVFWSKHVALHIRIRRCRDSDSPECMWDAGSFVCVCVCVKFLFVSFAHLSTDG